MVDIELANTNETANDISKCENTWHENTWHVEVISLKVYWWLESSGQSNEKQNHWIDFILKQEYSIFKAKYIHLALEYADYLFIGFSKEEIVSFAFCSDRPDPRYNLWSKHVSNKHGSLTISLIISSWKNSQKGFGKPLLFFMEHFAQSILVRQQINLMSLRIPKLRNYYLGCGYTEGVTNYKDGTIFMYKNFNKNLSTIEKLKRKKK